MVKCQWCPELHRSVDCPIRAAKILGKRRRDEDECDECGRAGHTAPDCPSLEEDYEEDAGAEEEAEEDEDDAISHVSACVVCKAELNQECVSTGGAECTFTDERAARIAKMNEQNAAAAGGGGADAKGGKLLKDKAKAMKKSERIEYLKKGHQPGTSTYLTEKDVKQLPLNEIHHLPLNMILPFRTIWRQWVWGHPVKDRANAFDDWKKGVAKKFEVDAPPVMGKVTTVDRESVKSDFEDVCALINPRPDVGQQSLMTRIDAQIAKSGQKLLTYKLARIEGWKVARTAEAIATGEADFEKSWVQSAALARKRVEEAQKVAAAAAAAAGGRGGGGGRGGNGQGRGRGRG